MKKPRCSAKAQGPYIYTLIGFPKKPHFRVQAPRAPQRVPALRTTPLGRARTSGTDHDASAGNSEIDFGLGKLSTIEDGPVINRGLETKMAVTSGNASCCCWLKFLAFARSISMLPVIWLATEAAGNQATFGRNHRRTTASKEAINKSKLKFKHYEDSLSKEWIQSVYSSLIPRKDAIWPTTRDIGSTGKWAIHTLIVYARARCHLFGCRSGSNTKSMQVRSVGSS